MTPCKCGCGRKIGVGKSFILGHNSMKERKLTEETKRKISKSKIGHFVSKETRRKMSISAKTSSYWLGKHHSSKTKKKISLKKKGINQTKEHKRKIGFSVKRTFIDNPEIIKGIRERRAKQIIPFKDVSTEVKIQNFLKQLGIEFYTHQYMHIEHGYQCDILIPYIKTIIECDGCYWHGCFLCNKDKKPNKKQIEQRERDKLRTQELQEKGYRVIRLWEHDINNLNIQEFQIKLSSISDSDK